MDYHVPVLLEQCIEGLNINPEGTYVDATFGGGGHAKMIIQQLTSGRLIGFDQDSDAARNAEELDQKKFTFIGVNFRYMKKYLRLNGVNKVDGVLADLGISSYQIDTPNRGFSTRHNAELDMRMDRQTAQTARDIVNTYDEAALHRILGQYGELRNAKTLAAAIVAARVRQPINTVEDLKQIVKPLAPRNRENKYQAQVFQALRIEVNDELNALRELLLQCEQVIETEGRLVVMSYHSLEDRLVKNFINKGNFRGKVQQDFYGNPQRPFKPLLRKPMTPTDEEMKANSRARSAKLRIAERLSWQRN